MSQGADQAQGQGRQVEGEAHLRDFALGDVSRWSIEKHLLAGA